MSGKAGTHIKVRQIAERVYPSFIDLSETEDELILRAELPGVSLERHRLQVEPHGVRIITIEQAEIGAGNPEGRQIVEAPQVLSLPIRLDPASTTASLNCGRLELRMPRAAQNRGEYALPKAS